MGRAHSVALCVILSGFVYVFMSDCGLHQPHVRMQAPVQRFTSPVPFSSGLLYSFLG